jgi:hypothetical protein
VAPRSGPERGKAYQSRAEAILIASWQTALTWIKWLAVGGGILAYVLLLIFQGPTLARWVGGALCAVGVLAFAASFALSHPWLTVGVAAVLVVLATDILDKASPWLTKAAGMVSDFLDHLKAPLDAVEAKIGAVLVKKTPVSASGTPAKA